MSFDSVCALASAVAACTATLQIALHHLTNLWRLLCNFRPN
jgi:hypothetical protein